MSVEQDIQKAQDFLKNYSVTSPPRWQFERILNHLEERLRVNVGLRYENADLKRRLRELENG